MRILFADSIDESQLSPLRDAGHEVVIDPALTADSLPAAITDSEILVVRSTRVTADAIAAGTRLGLVVRAGAGTDNIDRTAASQAGIYVCNVPGRNAVAVAELTMGLLLAVDRRIPDNTVDLRAGVWNKGQYSQADGIHGKRLSILGLGEIGLAVAERAKAFGMTVSAQRKDGRSPATLARIRATGIRLVDSLDELLVEADVLSIHVPKAPDTVRLIDAEVLSRLPEGAILVNTSRGEVIDEPALLEALDQRGLRAGLDVWGDEPSGSAGSFDSLLARHPRVVGTHHIGASTDQSQRSVAEGTVEVIEAYLAGRMVNCVNLLGEILGDQCLEVRHLDRVGVLAEIFAVLRSRGLNVQQMQNQPFEGAVAAVATIHVDGEADPSVLDELRAIEAVLAVAVALR